MISRVTGPRGAHDFAAVDEKGARHLPHIGPELARPVSPQKGSDPLSPDPWAHELTDTAAIEAEGGVELAGGILKMVDPVETGFLQECRHGLSALPMDEDEAPALPGDPGLVQLGELLPDEDSTEVPEEAEEERLFLRVLGQGEAVTQAMAGQGFCEGRHGRFHGHGMAGRLAAAMAWPWRLSCSLGVCIEVRSASWGNSS